MIKVIETIPYRNALYCYVVLSYGSSNGTFRLEKQNKYTLYVHHGSYFFRNGVVQ